MQVLINDRVEYEEYDINQEREKDSRFSIPDQSSCLGESVHLRLIFPGCRQRDLLCPGQFTLIHDINHQGHPGIIIGNNHHA